MSISRRRFLRSAAVVSAAAALRPQTFAFGKNAGWSNNAPNNEIRARTYSRAMFEPYVGDTFRVRVGKQMVDLKLVALTNATPVSGITTGKITRTDCFSIRFDATVPLPTRSSVHTLNHSKLGSFDLFMVQSKNRSKFSQTAIINHIA